MIRVSIIGATGYAGAELLLQKVILVKKFLKYILTYEDYMTKN